MDKKIPVLRVFDDKGNEIPIPAIQGPPGPSGPSGDGSGDMVAAMYDPKGRRKDIFSALDQKMDDTTNLCEVTSDFGFATGDQTKAGWRSLAGGYLTEATNTSFAFGCAVEATGKAAAGFGYGLVEDYPGKPCLMFDVALDDDTIVTDIEGIEVGDYININHPSCTISDTKRVVEVIVVETGYKYRLNSPFRASNYNESDVVNGVIPRGAKVRKIEPNEASGDSSFVAGRGNKATGECAVAEGRGTQSKGLGSHVEGTNNLSTGQGGHAEGMNTKAFSNASHAEGYLTEAGVEDKSAGTTAHAEGHTCKAKANNSHAEGYGTIAGSTNQHVQGKWNVEDKATKYAHIVGGGSSNTNRKNIHTIDWSGNAVFSGSVTALGGFVGGMKFVRGNYTAQGTTVSLSFNAVPDVIFIVCEINGEEVTGTSPGVLFPRLKMGFTFSDSRGNFSFPVSVVGTTVQFDVNLPVSIADEAYNYLALVEEVAT